MGVVSSGLADPRLRHDLTRTLARRLNASDVEDLVQSTLAEALGSARRPTDEEEIRRFVFSIARQRLVDLYRRRDRERRREVPEPLPTPPLGPSIDLLRWA